MNNEEKLALFWLSEKTLPNEIKAEISKAFWEDKKEVERTKKAFLDILKVNPGKQFGATTSRMRWWGYESQYDMRDMPGEINYGNPGMRYYLTTFHNFEEDLVYCLLCQQCVPMSRNNDHTREVWGGPPRAILKIVPYQRNSYYE